MVVVVAVVVVVESSCKAVADEEACLVAICTTK
jgi:hypothetical protein